MHYNTFGSYLAGLIEGDGSINVPTYIRDSRNRKRYPSIRICFNIKDKKVVEHLQFIFGGTYWINKNKTYIIYSIQKHNELVNIVNLINGYFRTPKIEALKRLIDFFNENLKEKDNEIIIFKGLDQSPIDSNGWLAGFSDSDGNFNINISKRKGTNNIRIQLSFRIEQKEQIKKYVSNQLGGASYYNICFKIANYFNVSLYNRIRKLNNKEFSIYLITAHNSKSHDLVISYFEKYPLLSSKYLNFIDWSTIHFMRKGKKYISEEELIKCINIKNRFNNKRINFNWDHLLLNYNKLLN